MRGLLRVVTYLRDSRALDDLRQAIVGEKNYRIESVRRIHGSWLVALGGIDTRAKAEALRGTELLALRSELPPLDVDEWYLADLVGLRAVGPDGRDLGIVTAVHDYGAGDILVLKRPPRQMADAEEQMVPLIPGVLREVRIDDGLIVVAPPEVE